MSNPVGLIKTIIQRENSKILGETYINSSLYSFGSPEQPQDFKSMTPVTNRISDDSTDEWFLVGISTWGATSRLVAD